MFLTVTWVGVFVSGALVIGFISGMLVTHRKLNSAISITRKWKQAAQTVDSKAQESFNHGYKMGLAAGVKAKILANS